MTASLPAASLAALPAASLVASLAGDAEIAGFFAPAAELSAMVRFEAALAEAEAEAGLIAGEAAGAIVAALGAFVPDEAAIVKGLRRDGVAVPELVRQIRAAVGEPHARAVHVGATSQDVVDTGLCLRLRDVLAVLGERLAGLVGALEAWRERQGDVPLMAHTRMQAALPFRAADKLGTWIAPLRAHGLRLDAIGSGGLAVQLGGPIGNGEGFDGRRAEVSAALAHRLGLVDAEPWHADRTRILDVAHALALLTGTIGKIGQDVALMAQTETGALRLAGGGTSSAMAHKANPVGAEILVALARMNAGLCGTLGQAMVHENERSGAAWTLEWLILPQIAETAGAALSIAGRLVDGAAFRPSGGPHH